MILKLIKELSERYGVHYKVEDKGVRIDLSDFMRAYSSASEEKDINAFSFLLNYSYQNLNEGYLFFVYDGDGFMMTEDDLKGTKEPTITEQRFNEVVSFISQFLNENGIKSKLIKCCLSARFKTEWNELTKSDVYNIVRMFRELGFRYYNKLLYSEELRRRGFVVTYRGEPILFKDGVSAFISFKDSFLENYNHHAYLTFYFTVQGDKFSLDEVSLAFYSFEK